MTLYCVYQRRIPILTQRKAFSAWLGIKVYEPERQENGENGMAFKKESFRPAAEHNNDWFSNIREEIINHGQTRENRFLATEASTRALIEAGYREIEKRECNDEKTHNALPSQEMRTYPLAILYDFESWLDKKQRKEASKARQSALLRFFRVPQVPAVHGSPNRSLLLTFFGLPL